ncbi:MAG: hypothetical protein L6V93_07020 [Clostridiales bacterium]|nr:MAG: hypothetical protein L6V93_07020 [Clostridiales bacterium]
MPYREYRKMFEKISAFSFEFAPLCERARITVSEYISIGAPTNISKMSFPAPFYIQ